MINPAAPDYTNIPTAPKRPSFDYSLADVSQLPYVTIITPFYNTGPIFHDTARSILQQSFQQWEWLIINDGSTDSEALSIIKSYRNCDPRIQVIDHDTNQGLSAARNTGFRLAQTQYIVQLDSDDLLEPTAVEKWCWFLESYPEYAFVKGYTVGFGAQQYLWEHGFHDGRAFLDVNWVNPTSMIRKAVHQAVGGYDDADHSGLMDWDFWLRCANRGYWGDTIPEYLDWYRRRPTHADRWPGFDNGKQQRAYRRKLREKYAQLWDKGFPEIQSHSRRQNSAVADKLQIGNRLQKHKPRLLILVPWLSLGGIDKFNLDLLKQLSQKGWEVTIATTLAGDHSWLPHFACYTPDIFILEHFLRLEDYPKFLSYLIGSREIDTVLISHSELAYLLLPYLRAHFPEVTFIDYCHIEDELWNNGGFPRIAVENQELLALNLVSSEHLKRWMVQNGADARKIEVCYTNIDAEEWCPDSKQRTAVRQELELTDTVPVILFVGRVCTQKQPRVLAHTLLRLRQQNLPFVMVVAGDGPKLEWLRTFIKTHKLDGQVRLLGAVSNERVRQLMRAADIFFLPSEWEGIALSIYEAMACSLPIVGADVGGQCELVTPECGALIKRSNEQTEADNYAQAIAALLKNPQYRLSLGQAGRKRVSAQFALAQMGDRMAALLAKINSSELSHPSSNSRPEEEPFPVERIIEDYRLSQKSFKLWAIQNKLNPLWSERNSQNWRVRFYLTLYRWHEPCYQWYTGQGWTWLLPIREKIKRVLLQGDR